ncbi:uncharacterized protein SOCEGT47_056750 [Sorangium cellulosum]|uniref:Competence protein CoiA-like N-terminal domain-containing protein n=2 Tax=Sorangium cellulosum TaxID=56 RepID=A0A4P2Q786_SORCE|nr:uncharacterized protein SOCEGT47_056750 [Sorangium cellulosum]
MRVAITWARTREIPSAAACRTPFLLPGDRGGITIIPGRAHRQAYTMQYALVSGQRSTPQPGLVGACPACNWPTVSKCGTKVMWHWAHKARRHCDPWWENETEWHRHWKSLFPDDAREVAHFDATTGEKHVADIKTETGLIIELQHSPMPSEELRAREHFYKNMIWIVDARPFAGQFHILGKLPPPDCDLVEDIVFYPQRHRDTGPGGFWRPSENPEPRGLVLYHSINEISKEIELLYQGHHFFEWIRPRAIWFDATAPVLLDFGGPCLWRLRAYDDRGLWSVQRTSKDAFIAENGGNPE